MTIPRAHQLCALSLQNCEAFLKARFGGDWKMEGEYGLTQEDEDVIESMPNVGYLKEVRYFSIENGLTSWAAIEFWDKIVEKLSDGKYPPGFSERY